MTNKTKCPVRRHKEPDLNDLKQANDENPGETHQEDGV